MSLNDALDNLHCAHVELADVAQFLASARFSLSPEHPAQPRFSHLTDALHQLDHEVQKLRLDLARGPA